MRKAAPEYATGAGERIRPPALSGRFGWLQRVGLVVVTAVGLSLMMYPSAATWFYLRAQSQTVSGYAQQVAAMPEPQRTDLLAAAEAYNKTLPPGPFQDPDGLANNPAADAAVDANYSSLLNADGSGLMAQLTIPSINVNLPVYHGVSTYTLEQGVGHLPGSSLPVGGTGTHAVLVAHTGVANAPLFTDLNKVVIGDTFSIATYGETLYYRVDQILVVSPDDMDALQIVPGEDYVTLVTCTPKWVNTYRLLVRGARIAAPTADTSSTFALGMNAGPGIPWWAVVIVGGTVLSLVTTRVLSARPQKPSHHRSRQRPSRVYYR